jgi:hypothetical protein
MITTPAVMSSEAIKIANIRRSDINLQGRKKTAPKGRTLSELFLAGLALIRQNVVYARHPGRRRPPAKISRANSSRLAVAVPTGAVTVGRGPLSANRPALTHARPYRGLVDFRCPTLASAQNAPASLAGRMRPMWVKALAGPTR